MSLAVTLNICSALSAAFATVLCDANTRLMPERVLRIFQERCSRRDYLHTAWCTSAKQTWFPLNETSRIVCMFKCAPVSSECLSDCRNTHNSASIRDGFVLCWLTAHFSVTRVRERAPCLQTQAICVRLIISVEIIISTFIDYFSNRLEFRVKRCSTHGHKWLWAHLMDTCMKQQIRRVTVTS